MAYVSSFMPYLHPLLTIGCLAAFSFTFATMSTVPLYASLKGTVSPLHPKPRRSQSFKLLSALSIAIGVAGTLPLVFFEASPKPPVCLYFN